MTMLIMLLLCVTSVGYADQKPVPSIQDRVLKVEKEFGIEAGLLYAIVKQESNFQPAAVNPNTNVGVSVTSHGLGQLTASTAWYQCRLKPDQIYNVNLNLRCSAKVLKYQLERFENNKKLALAAYNDGTPCVCDGKRYRYYGTQDYCGPKTSCGITGQIRNQAYVSEVLAKWTDYNTTKTLQASTAP